ncbi:hypothetical protein IB238_16405 [Rhizobium sp. ARZ01]|uniref:hypothetical protein n=1 Tax=Rhizobium sp. ARZ01 TaxID=2769313 RepID=UPI001784D759|nr:hypothetical protein [Rhizobium sp. ARZ01]MBD9374205.1 hypothetical protein [Rhizobium sp. ARZ01]
MTKLPSRIVRRLDDGRVVYRRHLRAKAVVLSEADHQAVETLGQRKSLSAAAIALLMLISFLLYRQGALPAPLAALCAAVFFSLSFLAEAVWGRRQNAILDTAPLFEGEGLEPMPSMLDLIRTAPTDLLRTIDNRGLRSGIILFGATLFASLFVLWKQIEGSNPTVPDTHPVVLVLMAAVSAMALRAVLKERRRRKAEKSR